MENFDSKPQECRLKENGVERNQHWGGCCMILAPKVMILTVICMCIML